MHYRTKGTCASSIEIVVEKTIITSVRFSGGCHGNSQGLSRLLEGMSASDVATMFEGIKCGRRNTSCPDQLAKALREILT